MAIFYADTAVGSPGTVPNKTKANKKDGRVRWMESQYTVPTPAPQIGDVIQWGTVVPGARVVMPLSSLNVSAGAASSTINVGDAASPTRYLAATAITAAANTAFTNPANGAASPETSDNSKGATDNCTIQSVVGGAALQPGQALCLRIAFVTD